MRAFIPVPGAFPETHPLRTKYLYYSTFVLPIQSALESTGCEVIRSCEPVQVPHTCWSFRLTDKDRTVRVLVDFTDTTNITVPPDKGTGDVLFKLKYALRSLEVYKKVKATGLPVVPGGYVLAPDGNPENENAKWLLKHQDRLRAIQRQEEPQIPLLTLMAYRAKDRCQERRELYKPEWDRKESKLPFPAYAERIARSRFVLNACGPDRTIDRKVVEFCAVGAAILSGRGLEDLVLPWGKRFIHGENVWFVDNVKDVEEAMGMKEEQRQRLVEGSQRLFDQVFSPISMGKWLVDSSWNVADRLHALAVKKEAES